MPSITIRVNFSETADVDKLFQMQRELFPGDQMIHADQVGYVLELDLERSSYFMGLLDMVPDLRGFEPFQEWQESQRAQIPLRFPFPGQLPDDQFDALVA